MLRENILHYEKIYRDALLQDVIPFWEKYSVDSESGGYFTCLERDGTVFDTDKFMWLQARQIWTFSMLYNRLEKNPAWLKLAKHGADFIRQFGMDEKGDWYFSLDRQGRPLVAAYNIFSDCFAAMALAEFGCAAGDDPARELALKTYWRIQQRWANPKGRFTKQFSQNRALLTLAPPMINIGMTCDLQRVLPQPGFEKVIDAAVAKIMNFHVDWKLKTVFENVNPDGSHPNHLDGRLLCPGHALEGMWFILEVARQRHDSELMHQAGEVALWTIERGWDEKFGGIFYFQDYEGLSPEHLDWDMKLWWVHLEALYTFALAHHLTGESIFAEWFTRIHEYAWPRFSDPEFGEWFGYLNRRGEVTHTLKGGKWKGCFHVPRALYLCATLFHEMAQ
jgi:N-acylglucosamine 2-epimerase